MTKKEFNEFRFSGLNAREISNKYMTMNRVSEDEKKIVVRIGRSHLLPTRYGYALILNQNHVVFLKEWQASDNYFGVEVLLNKDFFNVKEWGSFEDFEDTDDLLSWESWLNVAKQQQANEDIKVRWKIRKERRNND